jgi:hypothetical protein
MTLEEARDYVLDLFSAAWTAGTPALNSGVVPEVEYQNVDPGQSPLARGNEAWARVSVRHEAGDQRSLGVTGGRVFTRFGVVIVQIFVPSGKHGLVLVDRLGNVALSAFEGKETSAGSVWFRNAAYREAGVDNGFFQANVTAEFQYDTVK